jgi:hypothetical protein
MTRKDFQLVAGVLANAKSYMPALQWERLVIITAEELAQTNPRFDYAKFAEACGWELVA